jgi:6-phosphogluconolactonase (cycloisomerase 2 family)
MKFSKSSQLFLVSSIGILVAVLLSACGLSSVDFVYVASSAASPTSPNGQIDTMASDGATGALRKYASPVSSGGINPVSLAVDPVYENLYVANAGSNTIVHFAIDLNGGLTQKESVTLSATPVAITVNAAGTYLYAISGTSSAILSAYPLTSGVIGSTATFQQSMILNCTAASSPNANFPTDMIIPTGVTVLANNNAVYVAAYDKSAYNPSGSTSSSANGGWVFGVTIGASGAPVATNQCVSTGGPYTVAQAGTRPNSITAEPTSRFVYLTDYANSQMVAYTIMTGTFNGNTFYPLTALNIGPVKTGNEPAAIVIDPRGKFIYIANALDSDVVTYVIDLGTGAPSASQGLLGAGTDPRPVAITVDPAIGRFVYTANYLGNSVSGFVLNPTSGILTTAQASPYPVDSEPTAILAIPHGNHATQAIPQ